MDIGLIIGAVLLALAVAFWFTFATMGEAERKLGRDLTFGEMLFGAITLPYSLLFVWWVMQEPTQSKKARQ